MGYDDQGIGKRSQGIISSVVVELRVKHEGLGFSVTKKKAMTTRITFVEAKDVADLAFSLPKRVATNEYGCTLLLHPSCGRLQKGNDGESSKTQLALALKISSKLINWSKKKKTKRYALEKTSLICHCRRKKGHNIANCWYLEVCFFCGKKSNLEASYMEKKFTCHKPKCFQRKNGKKTCPRQPKTQRHMEKKSTSSSPCSAKDFCKVE